MSATMAARRDAPQPRHRKSKEKKAGRARHVVYGVMLGFLLILAALAGLGAAIDAGVVSPGSDTPTAPTAPPHGKPVPSKLTGG